MADPHNFKGLLEGQRSPCMMSLLLTTKQQAAPPPPVWNCHECASKCRFWVSWEGPLGGGLAAAGWAQLNPLLGAAPELLERQPAGGSRGLWTGQPGHQPASSLPSAAAALDDPSAAEDDSDSNGAKELLAPSACISFMPPAGPGLASTSSAPQGLCLRRKLFFYLLVSFHSSSRRCGKMQAADDKEGRKKMEEPSLFSRGCHQHKGAPPPSRSHPSERWWCFSAPSLHPSAWQKEAHVVQASPAGRVGGGDVAQVSTTASAYNYG